MVISVVTAACLAGSRTGSRSGKGQLDCSGPGRTKGRSPAPLDLSNLRHPLRGLGCVQGGVMLRDHRAAMPQHGAGCVEAGFPLKFQGARMTELVGVPMRNTVRLGLIRIVPL